MYINKMKNLIAILLVALFLLPMQTTAETKLVEGNLKMDNLLLNKLETDVQRIPVWVWTHDPDFTDVDRRIDEIVGPQWQFEGTDAEWMDLFIEIKQSLYREFWNDYITDFIQNVELEENELVVERTDAPVVVVWLTKEDVYRLADNDRVTAMYYYDLLENPGELEDITYSYTVTQALKILQASTGKIMGNLNWEYDVNRDGKVTPEDALLALQQATGKITITWPDDTVFPE